MAQRTYDGRANLVRFIEVTSAMFARKPLACKIDGSALEKEEAFHKALATFRRALSYIREKVGLDTPISLAASV